MNTHGYSHNPAVGLNMPLAKIVAGLKNLGPTSSRKTAADGRSDEERMLELAEFMQRYSTETITSALARWPSTDKKSWPSAEDISMFMDNIAGGQSGSQTSSDEGALVRDQQRNEFANLAVKIYQRVTKLVHGELALADRQELFALALNIANGQNFSFGVADREFWTVAQLVERIADYRHFDGYVTIRSSRARA